MFVIFLVIGLIALGGGTTFTGLSALDYNIGSVVIAFLIGAVAYRLGQIIRPSTKKNTTLNDIQQTLQPSQAGLASWEKQEPEEPEERAPTEPHSSRVIIKETTREIVKIPCRYCGALVVMTDSSCPNCGAPLR